MSAYNSTLIATAVSIATSPGYKNAVIIGSTVVAPEVTTYFMQGFDPDNQWFCYWNTTDPTMAPMATIPVSVIAHLVNIAIIHTL